MRGDASRATASSRTKFRHCRLHNGADTSLADSPSEWKPLGPKGLAPTIGAQSILLCARYVPVWRPQRSPCDPSKPRRVIDRQLRAAISAATFASERPPRHRSRVRPSSSRTRWWIVDHRRTERSAPSGNRLVEPAPTRCSPASVAAENDPGHRPRAVYSAHRFGALRDEAWGVNRSPATHRDP